VFHSINHFHPAEKADERGEASSLFVWARRSPEKFNVSENLF
jgi:hypothetical protein